MQVYQQLWSILLLRLTNPHPVDKERKRAEKAKKFAEKQASSLTQNNTISTSKAKEKKAKQETAKEEHLKEYKEETPPGQKKS